MTNIVSIVELGEIETCDLEIDHPDHQFYLANGVLTSNSHAVAYSIDSFWCAWLMTYYEEFWLTAYIESMLGNPEKKAKAFGEVKRLGYTIVPIDVNHATTEWTVLPGKKFMPSLLSCKGLGETAAEEIIANRPYESIEDILWNEDGSWRPSKFNKRSLENLIKAGAFNSLDCVGEGKIFNSYHHMHEVLIENSDLIKKSSKKDPYLGKKTFYEIARALAPDIKEWSRKERADNFVEVFGSLDVLDLAGDPLLELLEQRGVKSIDEWDKKDVYWMCIKSLVGKKSKNGKNYLLIDAIGPSGRSFKINAWGWNGVKTFEQYSVIIAELDRNEFGMSTVMWRVTSIT